MRIMLTTPVAPGVYAEMRRKGDRWEIYANDALVETIEDREEFKVLSRPSYKLLGLDTGEVRVIRFADLHRHSDNSLLDGMTKVRDMVERTEYAGALTDHGNMYGFLEYYKGMKKAGKKPILGFEGYMPDLNGDLSRRHVILLAKSRQGVANLFKLTSESYNHFYHRPHVTWEMMEKYREGVICASACVAGLIPVLIQQGDMSGVRQAIERFIGIYGKEDFYLEIQRHGLEAERVVNPCLLSLADEYGLKVIATTDAHYPVKEDAYPHEILLCIGTKQSIHDPAHMQYEGSGYHLQTSEEMEELFRDIPEVLDNTLELADKVNISLDLGRVNLPKYAIPAPYESPIAYLRALAERGFRERFAGTAHEQDPVYLDRFGYEIDMIEQMGFASYFIIVWDFINYAREHNIYVGPGRGSAAGSIVAYCLGITDLDPIRYNLLFERFLNPERVSYPDIDTDIEFNRRPEVIAYMTQKYGAENVCHIVTFSTLSAKQVVQDVARVLDYPASFGSCISNMIPAEVGMTISDALTHSPDLSAAYQKEASVKQVIDIASRLEGTKRHASQHACFEAGTRIYTARGPMSIENVTPGMYVWTHRNRFRPVVAAMTSETDTVYTVATERGHEVHVTGNHPFLTLRGGQSVPVWVPVEELNPASDRIYDLELTHAVPVRFSVSAATLSQPRTMYNLTVQDDSSYTANGLVVHNCGIVCAPSAVSDFLPTSMETDKETGQKGLTSQVTKDEVEELSLIKMDLLGLKTLGVIHEVMDRVQITRGVTEVRARIASEAPTLRYQDIPLDDREVYRMLAKGHTGAVFQLESEGMTKLIMQMFADIDTLPEERLGECFERLIAAVALYRPGPMDFIPNYIAGLQNHQNIRYLVPQLKEILEPTYGVIVYQEQVIQIVQKLAGFSLGEADVVRKAVGKKKQSLMEAEKKVFLYGNQKEYESGKSKDYFPGCIANGIPYKLASEIWNQMEDFAKYAFNRSHAACYAFLSYITAYMRCYWPEEFYAAMLNAFIDNSDKTRAYLNQASRCHIELLPPDVNLSEEKFIGFPGYIRFGLEGISGIRSVAESIPRERQEYGRYKDFQDLYERLADRGERWTKKIAEGLVYSGALSSFSDNKAALLRQYDLIDASYKQTAGDRRMGQCCLFSEEEMSIPLPQIEPMPREVETEREFSALGFYLSGHPTDKVLERIKPPAGYVPLPQLAMMEEQTGKRTVVTIGMVRNLKKFYTKKGEEMCTFSLETKYAAVSAVVFPHDLSVCNAYLTENGIVAAWGDYGRDAVRDGMQLIVTRLMDPDSLTPAAPTPVVVRVQSKEEQEIVLAYIRSHAGDTPVALECSGKTYPLKTGVAYNAAAIDFFQRMENRRVV